MAVLNVLCYTAYHGSPQIQTDSQRGRGWLTFTNQQHFLLQKKSLKLLLWTFCISVQCLTWSTTYRYKETPKEKEDGYHSATTNGNAAPAFQGNISARHFSAAPKNLQNRMFCVYSAAPPIQKWDLKFLIYSLAPSNSTVKHYHQLPHLLHRTIMFNIKYIMIQTDFQTPPNSTEGKYSVNRNLDLLL